MDENKQWYAIYTRPRWEKKITAKLQSYCIESYCPLNAICKQWADRKKVIHEPLFTSYVFVRVSYAEQLIVRNAHSNIKFVHWLGKPAIIREEEIEAIKDLLSQFKNVQVEKVNVNINDKVKIINGAFIFQEGKVMEVQSKSVKVYLPSLGYRLVAQFDKSNIEILNSFNKKAMMISGQ
jgi:transcription antitermination factor NusG